MNKVKAVDLARIARCSRAGVTKAKERGRIVALPDGAYDLDDPRVSSWIADSERKKGATPGTLSAVLAPREEPEEPADIAPMVDSSFTIEVDFGAGYVLVIRHNFDETQAEDDPVLGTIPESVRLDYDHNEAYAMGDGRRLPSRWTCGGRLTREAAYRGKIGAIGKDESRFFKRLGGSAIE